MGSRTRLKGGAEDQSSVSALMQSFFLQMQQPNSSSSIGGSCFPFGISNIQSLVSFNMDLAATNAGCQASQLQTIQQPNIGSGSTSHHNNSGRSNTADTLRRLVQNREAARRSRLRKKAYVKHLENSQQRLIELEQQQAHRQGIFISSRGDLSHVVSGNGTLPFDFEYALWLDEHNRQINVLRTAINSQAGDTEVQTMVDKVIAHFEDVFKLKANAAKADVFHILSGMWQTPAERCFMWIGGFRSSEILKLVKNQVEPLTEQQVMGIHNLQQYARRAEDALSQEMEAFLQTVAETLMNGYAGSSGSSENMANYMGQMAMAMGKLGTLHGYVRQADGVRQQALQRLHRLLTARQSARAIFAMNDYFNRLRALSSLWLARPRG